ncbi:MAG: flagellar basal-body MS-ring/collar protein FliF, partial [Spirochaetota bacterium]|nr:flagellar basal-body MS-ring/collar protein FliF [Spirochaetota bacterium]
MGIKYSEKDEKYIFVENEELATKLRAQLGVEGVVKEVKGFELFDQTEYTQTDFVRTVNYRRAITGNMVRHLEALDDIEKAEVTISFPENNRFYGKEYEDNPITASVVIRPASFSDILENKNKIRGIRDLISKGISGLKPENVIIMDEQSGKVLTEMLEVSESQEQIKKAREQLRVREKIRKSYIRDLEQALSGTLTPERYQLIVNLDLNWDIESESRHEIIPIKEKEDDPNTPFDESVVKLKIPVSVQETIESFKGPSFIPEGPPGTEPNVSPGGKELIDRYSDYKKVSKIENYQWSYADKQLKREPYKTKAVRVSVFVDGMWEKIREESGELKITKDGKIERKYAEVDKQDLQNIKKTIESYLDRKRGDSIEVKNIKFDRSKQFEKEDEEFRREQRMKNLMLAGIISVLAIIILFLLIRSIRKELARRRRLREEEFARQQQAMREAAMLAAEEEGLGLDIPPADRARLEMQENAINLARERPEDVAQLIRTWLVEE